MSSDYIENLKNDIQYLITDGKLESIRKDYIIDIIKRFKQVSKDNNLITILPKDTCCFVVGDIHGNFDSLITIVRYIMRTIRKFQNKHMVAVFVGDYVDRGRYGVEVLVMIMMLKICYGKYFIFLRGNHESAEINMNGGFYNECCTKFDEDMFNSLCSIYDYLPIGCAIQKRYFFVHGGIPENPSDLKKYIDVKLPFSVEKEKPLLKMLWCDPARDEIYYQVVREFNKARNCSFIFGEQATRDFIEYADVKMVVRGHEFKREGYHVSPDSRILTVFSSMNYQLSCTTHVPNDISGYLSKSGLVYINDTYDQIDGILTDIVVITLEYGVSNVNVFGNGEEFDSDVTPFQYIKGLTSYIHSALDNYIKRQYNTTFDLNSNQRVFPIGGKPVDLDVMQCEGITKIEFNDDIGDDIDNCIDTNNENVHVSSSDINVDGNIDTSPNGINKDIASDILDNMTSNQSPNVTYEQPVETVNEHQQDEHHSEYLSVNKLNWYDEQIREIELEKEISPEEYDFDYVQIYFKTDLNQLKDDINTILKSDDPIHFDKEYIENIINDFKTVSEGKDPEYHISMNSKCFVVGDILGDYESFIKILRFIMRVLKSHPDINVVFLGNYVDIGKNGMEIFVIVMMLKVMYTKNFIFLRGCHEFLEMNNSYGFRDECCDKYDNLIYIKVIECFNYLPISCVVNNRYWLVNSGIPSKIEYYKTEIGHDLPINVKEGSEMYGMVWSKPLPDNLYMTKVETKQSKGIMFGKKFLEWTFKNQHVDRMVKSNQLYINETLHLTPDRKVATIFSSMNFLIGNEYFKEKYRNKSVKATIYFINDKVENFAGYLTTDNLIIHFEKDAKTIDIDEDDGKLSPYQLIEKLNNYMYSGMYSVDDIGKDDMNRIDSKHSQCHGITSDKTEDINKYDLEKFRDISNL